MTFRLAALLCFIAPIARADDVHYQDFPVGNRALGLGGAYAAIANDPSGLYYNPAGLLGTSRASVSVSSSLYGVERNTAPDAPAIDFGNLRLSTIPSEIGGTYAIGELAPGKHAQAAWGFDVLVPSSRDGSVSRRDNGPDGWIDFRREATDRTVWIGAGYARSLSERLSAGVSAFYLHRTTTLTQRSTNAANDGRSFHDEVIQADASDGSMLLRFGLRWAKEGPWAFGLTLTTPNVAVRSAGRARVTRVSWNDPPMGEPPRAIELGADSARDPDSFAARTRLGASLRGGIAYVLQKKLTAACDLTAHAPVRYERFDIADTALADALRVPRRIEREAVVNGACGAEWLFRERMSIALGGFTDFSSAPQVPSDAALNEAVDANSVQPHVHLFGGTFALGYFGDYSLTRLGLSYASGVGDDTTYDPGERLWRRRAVAQTFAYVFVASTFRY